MVGFSAWMSAAEDDSSAWCVDPRRFRDFDLIGLDGWYVPSGAKHSKIAQWLCITSGPASFARCSASPFMAIVKTRSKVCKNGVCTKTRQLSDKLRDAVLSRTFNQNNKEKMLT